MDYIAILHGLSGKKKHTRIQESSKKRVDEGTGSAILGDAILADMLDSFHPFHER